MRGKWIDIALRGIVRGLTPEEVIEAMVPFMGISGDEYSEITRVTAILRLISKERGNE
jgi:hypothetical protein